MYSWGGGIWYRFFIFSLLSLTCLSSDKSQEFFTGLWIAAETAHHATGCCSASRFLNTSVASKPDPVNI